MEYNELRDIMLDNNEDKKSKSVKRILILVAVFVIIFLAVLIVMKFLNSSETNDQIAQTDSRLVLPPEPDNTRSIPQQVSVPATPPNEPAPQVAQANVPPVAPPPSEPQAQQPNPAFEQVPIVPENKGQDSFEDMVKALKEKEDKRQQDAGVPAPTPTESSTIQGALKQNDAPSAQPGESKAEPKQHVNVVKQKEPKQEKAAKQPKNDVAKEKQAKQKPAKQAPAASGGDAHSGSYVQVFAVKHFNEKAPELGKLKAAGYAYKLYRTNVNGNEIIKVLVGPYSGEQLKSELAKIKQSAAPNAFIVNIK
ncbi:putative sporulation domain protein [Campylobacter showae]|uniref:Sporulation and cell division repeat protein n=1 Tax=Campylobacter showae RM3277 TaxID=553219 RepID=C6RFS1_9BACT|nr:SPOR domain-containing protein [Campylobacter showae]EET79616.1 sporulation and cell division repeat protein [Campylobacter showae RM3277]QCD48493.1 putative sporulation domain protein [Campylobacter showae]